MIKRTLFEEEHEIFRDSIRKFLEAEAVPHYERWENQGYIDREFWYKAGEQGMLCPQVAIEYGGSGVDFRYNVVIAEELSKLYLSAVAVAFGVHSDIVTPYLEHFGTEEQKQKYLPKMASGEIIGAIAMSEPNAGSDVQSFRTSLVDQGNGTYLLNGSKIFISNGQTADLFFTATKTDTSKGAQGTTMALVEASWSGFERGKNLKKIGLKAQDTSEIFFNDVVVPEENILGKPGMGFVMMMQELAQERLSLCVGGLAAAEQVLEDTIRYVKERKAFGKEVAKFQNTRFKLAELSTKLHAARVYTDYCVDLHLSKKLSPAEVARLKVLSTDLQCEVADECLQLHGGYGYMWEYPVARAFADSRVQKIYAGTNEIMKELIAREMLG